MKRLSTSSRLADTVAVVRSLVLSDGRHLAVRIWPGSSTETIVFLHGLLDSSEGWAATCERRDGSDGRPTLTRIAFDLPGFGESDAPRTGTIDGYAADIAEGLEQLGVERCIVVGHSLGGGVAARLAERLADRVDALVLLAPVGFGRIALAQLARLPGVIDALGLGLPIALSNRLVISLCYRVMVTNGSPPDAALVARLNRQAPHLVAGARAAVAAIAAAGRAPESFSGRRLGYRGPVVAIWGDRDRLVPPGHRHALKRALPQARLELWSGMGHHPQEERLEDLLTLIRRISAPGQRVAPAATPAAAHVA